MARLNLGPVDQFTPLESVPFRDWLARLFGFVQTVPSVGSPQLTSGPSGQAQALPTNPDAYIPVQMPNGQTYLIPAYKVS